MDTARVFGPRYERRPAGFYGAPEAHRRRVIEPLDDPAPDEIARFTARIALREVGGPLPRIEGFAVKWLERSAQIAPGFFELIAPGAFHGLDNADCFVDHKSGLRLGSAWDGRLLLEQDDVGLRFSLDPIPDEAGRFVVALIRRNRCSQMSFGFECERDHWRDAEDGPERTVLRAELREISILTRKHRPAYFQKGGAFALGEPAPARLAA